ncbi:cytosine permease [Vibrio sp. PP-XX7]
MGDFYELDVTQDLADSQYFNEDLAPTKVAERTWNKFNIAALWVGMAVCVPTYTLGGVLTAYFGLSVPEALVTILLANIVVLVPLTLNAFRGDKVWDPLPYIASFFIWYFWFKYTLSYPGSGSLWLVRYPDHVRWPRDPSALLRDQQSLGKSGHCGGSFRLLYFLATQYWDRD